MKRFHTFLLGHAFISLVIITIFAYSYVKPLSVVALHLMLVLSLYFSVFMFARLWRSKFKLVSVVLFSALTCCFLLVYLANYLSNAFWNDNVSWSFVLTYLADLNQVLEEVNYAVAILFAGLSALALLILWGYYKFATYLHEYDHHLSIKSTKIYLLITLIAPAYLLLSFSPEEPGLWDGEPLTSLALKSNTISYSDQSVENIEFANHKVNRQLSNIILIHADALRADHTSFHGYHRDTTPYIHSLIQQNGVKIDMGLSMCSESVCGMLAALGSQHPDHISAQTPLLHTYLKQAGYRTIFTGSGNFDWGALSLAFKDQRDIDYFARADRSELFSIHDDFIILDTLNKIPAYEGVPTFFFLRYLSSHHLGRHYVQYRQFLPAEKGLLSFIFSGLADDQVLVNAYDNYILQLDDLVRQSLEQLKAKGYLENSMIVIFGDHGEAFGEHGYHGHYKNLYQEEIHVPIVFIGDKSNLIKETELATLNDILPTLLELNNLPEAENINGVSLLTPTEPERITFHDSRTGELGTVTRVQGKIYKLIVDTKSQEVFLYNLSDDPAEKQNIYQQHLALSNQLIEAMAQFFGQEEIPAELLATH